MSNQEAELRLQIPAIVGALPFCLFHRDDDVSARFVIRRKRHDIGWFGKVHEFAMKLGHMRINGEHDRHLPVTQHAFLLERKTAQLAQPRKKFIIESTGEVDWLHGARKRGAHRSGTGKGSSGGLIQPLPVRASRCPLNEDRHQLAKILRG